MPDLVLFANAAQDWLYDEGEDTTKAAYVAKMDEIRFVAGPIIQRYQDKIEAERQALLKAQEEEAARKRADAEAKKKAEEEARKAKEQANKASAKDGGADLQVEDIEMTDADGEVVKPNSVDEPSSAK